MSNNIMEVIPLQHNAVVQPDGEIQYCKPVSINKHNPYLNQSIDNDNIQDYREIMCNGETISIHVTTLNNALNIQYKAHIVRFLCFLDFMMNLVIAMTAYYGSLYSLGIAIISLIGYYSTFIYSRIGLITYLLYQYCHSLVKLTILGFYIAAATGWHTLEIKNTTHLVIDITPTYIILVSLSTIGQLYITYFIQQFYNLLPPKAIELADQTRFSTV